MTIIIDIVIIELGPRNLYMLYVPNTNVYYDYMPF